MYKAIDPAHQMNGTAVVLLLDWPNLGLFQRIVHRKMIRQNSRYLIDETMPAGLYTIILANTGEAERFVVY